MGVENNDHNLEVGSRLRSARKALKTSASIIGAAVGLSEVAVRAHETGQNAVSVVQGVAYARALHCRAEWLLLGSGPSGQDLAQALFVGMETRGYLFEGFTAERAVFRLIDNLIARVCELEAPLIARGSPRNLTVVQ